MLISQYSRQKHPKREEEDGEDFWNVCISCSSCSLLVWITAAGERQEEMWPKISELTSSLADIERAPSRPWFNGMIPSLLYTPWSHRYPTLELMTCLQRIIQRKFQSWSVHLVRYCVTGLSLFIHQQLVSVFMHNHNIQKEICLNVIFPPKLFRFNSCCIKMPTMSLSCLLLDLSTLIFNSRWPNVYRKWC